MENRIETYANKLLESASALQAEDVYLQPKRDRYDILIRLGENFHPYEKLDLENGERLLRYFKYQAHMDVGEKRLPQDGSFDLICNESRIELRLSTIANYRHQESLVIRLLYSNKQVPLNSYQQDLLVSLDTYLNKKSGLILFSGPVSSGKTTLIHQCLSRRYERAPCSIITMEDPVEIKDDRFLQAQVNLKAGVDYDHLIKASLRHHPDILVIGEIRDTKTARMVIRAALTGHLVLATVHAKNCLGVIDRLLELDISKQQLLQTLCLVTAQRLVPTTSSSRLLILERILEQDIVAYILEQKQKVNYQTLDDILKEAWQSGKITKNIYQAYSLGL